MKIQFFELSDDIIIGVSGATQLALMNLAISQLGRREPAKFPLASSLRLARRDLVKLRKSVYPAPEQMVN